MAQPKRKWSKQRTHKHRANWKIESPNLVECPQCHEPKLPHRICPNCGYYKNRKVVNEE